jgi:hypothetical protein
MRHFHKRAFGLFDDLDMIPWSSDRLQFRSQNGRPDRFDATPAASAIASGIVTASGTRRLVPQCFQTTFSAASVSLPIPPPSPTAFTINIKWDASVASAPDGSTSDVIAAVLYLESHFIDAVTININVGYQEIAGNAIGNSLGQSLTNLSAVSYADLVGAMRTDARTETDASVVLSLPGSSPVNPAKYWTTTSEAKALGLAEANGTGLDGSVGLARGRCSPTVSPRLAARWRPVHTISSPRCCTNSPKSWAANC